jgi:hypothetical protein
VTTALTAKAAWESQRGACRKVAATVPLPGLKTMAQQEVMMSGSSASR